MRRARTRTAAPLFAAALLALVVSAPALAAAVEADAVLGLWATEDNEAHVEIVKNGDSYSGAIVWLDEPIYPDDDEQGMAGRPKVDRENPDPDLRERPVVGLEILDGFRYAGDGLWKGGKIYDPDNGKTYKSKMTLREDGVLFVRGFIGLSLLGRTTEWTRVEP